MQVVFTPNSLLFRPEEEGAEMIIVDEKNFEIL
jgi:hypothetical protein